MSKGTPGFMGEKLSQALRLRRIKPITLANEIGVTRSSISAYEKNLRSPSPEIMGQICQVLNLPLSFFVNNSIYLPKSNSPLFYRSYFSKLKMAREAAEEKHRIFSSMVFYLDRFVSFPPSNIPLFDVPSDPTEIDEKQIEEISQKTRKYWGLNLGPISNVIYLLENNGIFVGKFPFGCDKLDAFSQNIEGRYFQIIIGSDKGSAVRQRFDAAHELGHIVLHRKIPKEIVKSEVFHGLLEYQANQFAFEFLFPTPAFKNEVKRYSIGEFINLKRKWKVSVASQVQRASKPDIAGVVEMAPLQRTISRNGWRKNEPLDNELICEEPRLIKDAFKIVLETRTQSPQDVYNNFCLHFSDIEQIAGLPDGYLSSFEQEKSKVIDLKDEFKTRNTIDIDDPVDFDYEETKNVSNRKTNVYSFLDAFAQKT
ncbi:XRE family transcriptional regulator [Thermosynechococcaceae cyanobacterium BACA0444]|uniref:XRE family transcriptional regulator n=1 Tax=Pseudocalidococcus azoricus BACA0444 TaxID=2918990 RepID=A0AAE4JVJ5_9CYAN|nr:XRE family transcriptional regulator [Pseudocalidococcus azoricus]MDS3860096.1 XRE family transcriptional regulator [Pseudocalidococcus azoricus BACA0444]